MVVLISKNRAAIALLLLFAGLDAAAAPYPPSTVITDITFDESTHKTTANDSDNWAITWADDDEQYTTFGDGHGFQDSPKASIGVARIDGDKEAVRGADLYEAGKQAGCSGMVGPCDGKSYGIISIDGDLYMWVSPLSNINAYRYSRVWKSTDKGLTWQGASWEFVGEDAFGNNNHGFLNPSFLQFGKDYAGARDNFVYIYANELKTTSEFNVQKPGEITLMRVPKGSIMDRNAYEFFAGLDGGNNPVWTADIQQRQPVLEDSEGVSWSGTSAIYNAGLDRYLLITQHTQTTRSNIGIFDGPTPWGPWTTVLYERWQVDIDGQTAFHWNFSSKWMSNDGKRFVLIYSGVNAQDSWESIEGEFITDGGGNADTVAPKAPTNLTVN